MRSGLFHLDDSIDTKKEKRLMQHALRALLAVFLSLAADATLAGQSRLATFSCDVTPPLGAPMFCGDALRTIEEPLLAKGVVIHAGGERYVLCAIDWCLLCNGSYQAIRNEIAIAAQTEPSRVAVQTVHQHTAPLVDIDAQQLLADIGDPSPHIEPKALEAIQQRLAAAVRQSLNRFEPFDHIGTGQAPVDRVASTRRFIDTAGKIHGRSSSCKDPAVTALPEGIIDPYLKTITLACGQKPLVRLHYYATHPQSRYGDGRATSDFVGIARERMQKKEGVFQIYFNGCGGDVTAGKYNDGSDKCRAELAERLFAGMEGSIAATKLVAAGVIQWKSHPLVFPRRTDSGFTIADCMTCMKDPKSNPVMKLYQGAMRAASLKRADQPIELSSLHIGDVHILHLPGEPLIEFQLFAQRLKPTEFVAVAGYGDNATGYLCPERAFHEKGYEPSVSIVKPESEGLVKRAMATLLDATLASQSP
jgi:hypothetical protein